MTPGALPGRTAARNAEGPDAARRGRWIRRLCGAVMVASVAEFVIATPGVQIHRLPHSTDFATYYLAGAQTRDHESPYERAALAARGRTLGFDYDQFPFLYPPPFALALQPLARLDYPRARQVWMLGATAWLLGAMAVMVQLVRRQAAWLGIESPAAVWLVLGAFFPAALNSTSVHNDVRAGSVGCLLFLCAATIALQLLPRWAPRRPAPGEILPGTATSHAGWSDAWLALALVVATQAKLVPLVFVPLVAWRGRWRAASWTVMGIVLLLVPALVHWGPGIFVSYVRDGLLPSTHAEVDPASNQSLDAVLGRLLVHTEWAQSPIDAPALKRILSALATLAVGLVTLRRLRRPRRAAALLPVEFGYVVLAVLLVMKLTWVQTLTMMLFVWPAVLLAVWRALENGANWARRAAVVGSASFFLSSAHVPILWPGLQHGPLVVVTAVHCVGILGLWATCGWILAHENDVVGTASLRGAQ